MKYLAILLFSGVAALAQPTVSNIRLDYVPAPNGAAAHSYMRFRWNVSSSACYHRILFGKTSSYGDILANGYCQTNDLGFPLSGLAPNTTYYYQVQSSFDGANWSTGGTGSFTTAPLPSPHPAPPQISGLWTPTFPDTSGYNTVTVANDCSNLNSLIAAAVALQPTNGTVITILNETLASGACGAFSFPNDSQILTVPQASSNVNTSTGAFTASNSVPGWTLANGQAVTMMGSSMPGSQTTGNDNNSFNPNTGGNNNGPFQYNTPYYLVGVSGSTFQLSATPGGSPIIPADTGSVGGTMMLEQWPRQNQNWIVIQTSTPDSQFCPQGVRCMGSIWQSLMASIRNPGGVYNSNITGGYFTHHVWFRGLDWSTTDASSLANSTIDPQPSNWLINFPYTWASDHIVIDRCYIHGQPFPNRYQGAIILGGSYVGFMDNDLEDFEYWRPSATPVLLGNTAEGLSGTLASQVLTIIPGVIKAPLNTCTATANITFSIAGGSESGTAYVYASPSCVPTLVLPTGGSAACTGSMTDSNSNSHACTVITASSPNWPRDGSNGINAFTLGTFTLAGGAPSGYSGTQNFNQSNWFFEGSQTVQSAAGPGPFSILNNYMEATGLLWHFSDDSAVQPMNVWLRQNLVTWNQAYRMGSPTSDGYEYAERNGPEMKHGQVVKVDGNVVTGSWNSVSLTGPAMLFHTAANQGTVGTQTGFTIQDIDITNNTFLNHTTCIELGGGVLNMTPFPAAARIRIQNNICNTNAWTQTDGNTGAAGLGGGAGAAFELDGPIEDLIVDHNTLYDTRGSNPQVWHAQVNWIEGCQVTNNFLWFNQNAFGFTGEQNGQTVLTPPINGIGSTFFNSECTNDPNTPGGIISNNVAVPYYSPSGPGTPSGYVSPRSVCTTFGGGTLIGNHCPGGQIAIVLNGASPAANLAAIGFTNPTIGNLKLRYNSAYVSGGHVASDDIDIGADMNALLAAQGAVGVPEATPIGSTTANITWFAYDSTVACSVDYAESPNDPSTHVGGGRAPASLGNSQAVSLTGLSAATQYNYRVLCPVMQPTGAFTTWGFRRR